MNKYELALIVTAKIEDSARAEIVEKAKGYITRAGGVISGVEEWGKKRLAYEIRYEREGYYYFIHFESDPSAPAAIERDVRIMDNLLRYLIIRKDDNFVFEQPEVEEEAAQSEETEKEGAGASEESAEVSKEEADEASEEAVVDAEDSDSEAEAQTQE